MTDTSGWDGPKMESYWEIDFSPHFIYKFSGSLPAQIEGPQGMISITTAIEMGRVRLWVPTTTGWVMKGIKGG